MTDNLRLSRSEQQQRTRTALVAAAARTFARDGYHAASLEAIAASAGYSKGAVYSNFRGKAELFLAVMELGIQAVEQQPSQLWGEVPTGPDASPRPMSDWDGVGIALATLEYVAAASRDPDLAPQLAEFAQRVVAHFTELARHSRSDADPLEPEDLGVLLTALHQGLGLLSLIPGLTDERRPARIDPWLWTAGMRRLADPGRAGYTLPPAPTTPPRPTAEDPAAS